MSFTHSCASSQYVTKKIGDNMLPCGGQDVNFTDFEINVQILTLWL